MKVGLFFATDTGNTRKIAKMIKRKYFAEDEIEICNVQKATAGMIDACDALIFGTPTLGDGEYPEHLEAFIPQLGSVDFSRKTVALYGLGDQVEYGMEFVDALGMFYEELISLGANIIGFWPTDGYEYEFSRAEMEDGQFCGLVLDQDNQSGQTEARLEAWIAAVRPLLLEAAGKAAA